MLPSPASLHKGVLEITMATRKTSLENKNLRRCGYFAIIPELFSHSIMLEKYAKTRLFCALLNETQGIEDLHTQVVITTENVVISRCCFAKDSMALF